MNEATHHPGVREQHLLRIQSNFLFDEQRRQIDAKTLERARLHDHSDLEQFMADFQQLVKNAVGLEPNTPSETILELKENLDQCYQRACALPGDQTEIKNAIVKLVGIVMQSIWSGIGNDAYAKQQLEDEELARKEHFALQEIPLVAALTHTESPVAEDELIPCLLGESYGLLTQVLHLFDEQQIATIFNDASAFLADKDPQHNHKGAWNNLALIETYYRDVQPQSSQNL